MTTTLTHKTTGYDPTVNTRTIGKPVSALTYTLAQHIKTFNSNERVTVCVQEETGQTLCVTVMRADAVKRYVHLATRPGQIVTVLPARPTTTTASATAAVQ
jgi:hypothetical protein